MKNKTHRQSKGTKLYAVRDKTGRFKDIEAYARAHNKELKRLAGLPATEALKIAGTPTAAAKLLRIPRTTFNSRLDSERLDRAPPEKKGDVATLQSQLRSMATTLAETRAALKLAQDLSAPVKFKALKSAKRKKNPLGEKHLFIPDVQAKEGVPLDHMTWAGEFAADKRPDVIVLAGDIWDMPSLSSYDRGKLQFEGRRYKIDIEAGKAAMDLFLAPIRKAKNYRPRIEVTLGNHENRVNTCIEDNPILKGTIGTEDFQLEKMGVGVHEFLKTLTIEDVTYSHFFPRSARGRIVQTRQGAPSATAQLVRQGGSAIAGHAQGLDAQPLFLNGRLQWGIIAGSFYQHDEPYLGPQGTVYWRGVVMLHEVMAGKLNPMFVTLDYLRLKYA